MSNDLIFQRYITKHVWKDYTNNVFKRHFCYNCPQSETIGFITEGIFCPIVNLVLNITEKPICTEYDWLKYLMEKV